MKTIKYLAAGVLISTFTCNVWSAGHSTCVINYLEFEGNVSHLDLPVCPDSVEMDPSEGFCRLGLVGDKAYLYTFKLVDKSMCMVDAKEVPLSDFLTK